jgi:Holliday junction resolvase RusA-like endonuclease
MAKRKKVIRPDFFGVAGTFYCFVLTGNIPSKKNRIRFSAGRVYHDSKFEKWHKQAMVEMLPQALVEGCFAVTKCVTIYFEFESQRAKDLTNAAESVMDLLVDTGILKDDSYKIVPKLILVGSYNKGVSRTKIEVEV